MGGHKPDGEKPSSSGKRKVKFTPKAPPPRRSQPTAQQKAEVGDEERGAAETQALLRLVNVNQVRREPKLEKKSSVVVTFGPAPATSSTPLRTFNVSRDGNISKNSDSGLEGSSCDDEHIPFTSPSAAKIDGMDTSSVEATDAPDKNTKEEYRPPWDYHHTYYPTTLPLRRPYAGDPEILDKEEFGESATKLEYDENTINPASDLGLLEKSDKKKMLLVQLPPNLPLVKRTASKKSNNGAGSSKAVNPVGASEKSCSLEDLPGGYMGKMMVYKSGAIKLKLGNILYDVAPGSDCTFPQVAASINTADKSCCVLGELGERAVVTPNIDSILSTVDLD